MEIIEIGKHKLKDNYSYGDIIKGLKNCEDDKFIFINNNEVIIYISTEIIKLKGFNVLSVLVTNRLYFEEDPLFFSDCKYRKTFVYYETLKEFPTNIVNKKNSYIWEFEGVTRTIGYKKMEFFNPTIFLKDSEYKKIRAVNSNTNYVYLGEEPEFSEYFINVNTMEQLKINGNDFFSNNYIIDIEKEVEMGGEKYLSIRDNDGKYYLINQFNLKPLFVYGTDLVIISVNSLYDKKYRFGKEYSRVSVCKLKNLYDINRLSEYRYINSITLEEMPFYLQII